jgi:hypothetical protein
MGSAVTASDETVLPMRKSDVDKLAHQAGGLSAGMMSVRIKLDVILSAHGHELPENVRLSLRETLELVNDYREKYDVL